MIARGRRPHRLDADLRPAARRHHPAGRRPAAGRARGRGRRARRARGDGRRRAASGACRSRRRSSSNTATTAPTHGRSSKRGFGNADPAHARARSTSIRRPAAKARRARSSPARCAGSAIDVTEQPVSDGRFNVIAAVGQPDVVFSTHFDCVPPFFREPRVGRAALRPRLVRREGHARGADRRRRTAARGGRVACRPAVRRRRRAGQRRREGREPRRARLAIPDQRRADRQPARDGHARRLSRASARPSGRAAHSSLPELGDSAIEKLIDALVALRSVELAVGSRSGTRRSTPSG